MKQRIFLTGGGGMVGQNILEHPHSVNWDFLAPSSNELDLTDFEATKAFIGKHKPDIVIHSAGLVGGIQANMARPVDFLITNIDLGRNVLLAAHKTGVPKLINIASSCMYPRNAENPLKEDQILKGELEPTNEGYAIAKIFATRLCEYIQKENTNRHYKTVIPCNLYGRYDKFDPKNSHLIPAIIHKIHKAKQRGEKAVEIWGDGAARREFMYAGDLADAIYRILENFEEAPSLMNIGIGLDYSINEYYQIVKEVIGWDGQFQHDLSKPAGMRQKLVSVERQKAWGWEAKTDLNKGIELAYKYMLSNSIS